MFNWCFLCNGFEFTFWYKMWVDLWHNTTTKKDWHSVKDNFNFNLTRQTFWT